MAINKVMRAALKAITSLEPDVKKTYKMERQFQILTSRLRGKPKDYKMWDHTVCCEGHAIPVRLFAPSRKRALPLLLFFHGGGWVTGGIENYTGVCADLAKATNCTIASVDYRLAPEHKFPAAVEDCYAVTREFFLGRIPRVNPDHITLIGDSAGGNLAAAVSLMARDRGEFLPRRQILLYPSTYSDHSERSPFPSIRENGTDYLLTSKRIQSFIELYRSSDNDLNNPYFAPLLASDFSRQPRTLLITAEYCPLRDEGEAYGEKLHAAGNDVQVVRIPDALHAYMMLPPRFEQVQQTYRIINGFLRKGNLHGRT
ncbi:alpha/beta hydrolase [Faecalispora sporosphaeroides]|uniref:alpha/beta hydrolase n=1 Tax=Faecalispora sporosphaeroides TaxID=1549 RepID=UPI000366DFEB|nr:alpha/beta hydrolase [Faecalispora sporosphaeroides]